MSTQRTDTKDGAIFVDSGIAVDKHRGLLDVISAIQHYYVAEKNGNDIDPNFLTVKGALNFFIVGFKIGLLVGFLELLLTPVMFGVIDKVIPIFGSYNPSKIDMLIAFLISSCFSIGLIFLLLMLSKFYIGAVTKLTIKELLTGLSIGIFLKSLIIFIFFHVLYFKILIPSVLIPPMTTLSNWTNYNFANKIYITILNIRNVLISSSYYIVFLGLLTIIIPTVAIYIRSRSGIKKKKIDKEAWGN